MKPKIALITLLTRDLPAMRAFYEGVLGFKSVTELGAYVEYHSEGVRFAVCETGVMVDTVSAAAYSIVPRGQRVELAFPCDSPAEVDREFNRVITAGGGLVRAPADMPWGQRAAFFSDPEGNIHELFANLPAEGRGEAQS